MNTPPPTHTQTHIYIYIKYTYILNILNILNIYIYIYIYIKEIVCNSLVNWMVYIYEHNRMKIKDRVLRFTRKRFRWCYFSSVYDGCHFVLLIWRCLGIKYEFEVILITRYFKRFCNLSLFIEQRFEFICEIIFIRFS